MDNDLNKVDTTSEPETTEQPTETNPAQETAPSGPQLGKQLNKRPPKKQPAPTTAAETEPETPADPDATDQEQPTPTERPAPPTPTAPPLSTTAQALKATLQFGLPRAENLTPGNRPAASITKTEANLAADSIASTETTSDKKIETLIAKGKQYGKLAKDSALKGEAFCRERANQTAIEQKPPIDLAEIQAELEAATAGLERRLKTAEGIKDPAVRADKMREIQAEYSAELMRISGNAHPDHMLTSFGPNGEVTREKATTALGNTARQSLLILAVAPKEKIDEIIRETRAGNGDPSRKAFYDPDAYGGKSPLLKGGDEENETYTMIKSLAYDRKGETIERIRFAQLAADYALAGDWNGAARCVDTLMGKTPVKRNNKEVLTFPKDTPIDLVYHLIQAVIWKEHARACRESADLIRKEQAQKDKRAAFANVLPDPRETRRNTEAARNNAEPAPAPTPAPSDEERAKAQTDGAINAAKVELAHITKSHDPKDPWPVDRLRALSLSVAKYHPQYAEIAERRKIHERNPNTTDTTALTADQFKGFSIAFGRELLNLDASFKPLETTN